MDRYWWTDACLTGWPLIYMKWAVHRNEGCILIAEVLFNGVSLRWCPNNDLIETDRYRWATTAPPSEWQRKQFVVVVFWKWVNDMSMTCYRKWNGQRDGLDIVFTFIRKRRGEEAILGVLLIWLLSGANNSFFWRGTLEKYSSVKPFRYTLLQGCWKRRFKIVVRI